MYTLKQKKSIEVNIEQIQRRKDIMEGNKQKEIESI